MVDKTDWEVVDGPSPSERFRQQFGDGFGEQSARGRNQTKQAFEQMFKARLGTLWRWKLAGAAMLASLAVVFFAAVTGVIVLLVAAGALAMVGFSRIRKLFRRGATPSSLQRRDHTF